MIDMYSYVWSQVKCRSGMLLSMAASERPHSSPASSEFVCLELIDLCA